MAKNNLVILTGNIGAEAKIIETEQSTFVSASLATTDSYKDENEEWQQTETVWHNLISFHPVVIETFKILKKGTRIKIKGSVSYRKFQAVNEEGRLLTTEDGTPILKQEATIRVDAVELAPLFKKR